MPINFYILAKFKLGENHDLSDYGKQYEGRFKDAKLPYVKPSKPDGKSPITGFAVLALTLGSGCSSQVISQDGKFVAAPTSYFAYAINTCFKGSDDDHTYYMFKYGVFGAFGFVGLVEFLDKDCTQRTNPGPCPLNLLGSDPCPVDIPLPVNVCIQPNIPVIPVDIASLEVYFYSGSTLPNLPVAAAQYTTFM